MMVCVCFDPNPLLEHREFLVRDQRAEVSRRHAYITPDYQFGTLHVEDLGSVNGIWINRVKMQPKMKHQLKAGDELVLGGSDQNQKTGSKLAKKLDTRIYAFMVEECLDPLFPT